MIKRFLKKILPPQEKVFFTYFERSAKICQQSSKILFDVIHKGLSEERMVLARELKHKSNNLTKEILTRLNATFITPIDREDIQQVNLLLNKITRKIVKATLILKTYQLVEFPAVLKQQSEMILKATDELNLIMNKFKNFKKVKEITQSNERMDEIETHGDEILYHAMLDLFSGKYDPLTVIKLRDIYNNIESALDLCFNVSDTIVNIVLKHT
jgi:uncharacterized protein Yka (UPF0111/DUF47 family)